MGAMTQYERVANSQTPTSPTRSPFNTSGSPDGHSRVPSNTFGSRGSSLLSNRPTIRMQEAPSSPVSISPPRTDLRQPSSALVNGSPTSSRPNSRKSSRDVHTPDSGALRDSISNLSLADRPGVAEAERRTASRASKASSTSHHQLNDLPEDEEVGSDSTPQLQYHHQLFNDSPVKKSQRASQSTTNSSSSNGEQGSHLRLPRTNLARPSSSMSLDARGRLSPHSAVDDNHSPAGSPRTYARGVSGSRRSPDTRPVSYIDLLNEVPYAQQVAPVPMFNNMALQQAVGNNASLLDTKKTLDMYRANVKKTTDSAVQYEFAIFMVNTARDAIATGQNVGSGPDSATEMIKEARNLLQKLSDRGYPFAQYYLGDGYFSGFFHKDKPDYDKAFPLFVAASKHGHAEAGYRAALCYEFGWGCGQSYPKAVQFYRNAASKGHPGAAVRLGKACLTGDMGLGNRYREGVKWLKRAHESADMQYNSGPYELGLLHITGYGDDIFKDEAYAASLLTQSADLGHIDANYRMGQAYENGLLGCPRDAALSVHFYNGAATRGMPEAMMALCAWYMVGAAPVLEKDEIEAFEWARKAAELGESDPGRTCRF